MTLLDAAVRLRLHPNTIMRYCRTGILMATWSKLGYMDISQMAIDEYKVRHPRTKPISLRLRYLHSDGDPHAKRGSTRDHSARY